MAWWAFPRFGAAVVCVGLASALLGCAAGGATDEPQIEVVTGGGGEESGAGGDGNAMAVGSGGAAEGGAGEGGEGGSDPCALGCPDGFWDIDGNPLTGTCGCEYECEKLSDDDPIDPDFEDDNCDGGDGVVEQCVYVSTSLGDALGAGTRQDPVDTIANGILLAQTSTVPAVCVSGEVYTEPVTMVSGISVYGGFAQQDADFPFRRSPLAVSKIEVTGTVFYAPQIDQPTNIAGFTIHALTPSTAGDSTYGVRLASGTGGLYVRYNVIRAFKGKDGATGDNGTPHGSAQAMNGAMGGDGKSNGDVTPNGAPQPACTEFGGAGGTGGYAANGQSGFPGTGNAAAGGGGDVAPICFGTGDSGGPGDSFTVNGLPGPSFGGGAALGTIAGAIYVPSNGSDGAVGFNGKGGSGGGGGGGGVETVVCNKDTGGGGGAGGCGGLGGDFGRAGGGGGGSFAVFAAAGTIVVEGNDMTVDGGGKGGNGGNGANGQFGGDGGPGGPGKDDSGPGGQGGNGSDGGAGGPGSGGGGGPSACLAYGTAASTTFQMNVGCAVNVPGAGGDGGTNNQGGEGEDGLDGSGGPTLQIQ